MRYIIWGVFCGIVDKKHVFYKKKEVYRGGKKIFYCFVDISVYYTHINVGQSFRECGGDG